VHVVIIGFASFDTNLKFIYEYTGLSDEPQQIKVKNINPYLVEGSDITIESRSKPICNVPKISKGSQPTDDGNLIFNSKEELNDFLIKEPSAERYVRKYVGSREFINNIDRWCLWLVDVKPDELAKMPFILERMEKVKQFRSQSTSPATREFFSHHLFQQNHQPKTDYLVIPSVSSEKRQYIPIGFYGPDTVTSNLCLIIPNISMYEFGILTSQMHMAWTKYTCGRLKSDYRYSASIVYNNFPWPLSSQSKQIELVEGLAEKILAIRLIYPESSLSDLYNPITMPADLKRAHQDLDKAVDQAYRSQPFTSEAKRMEFLFELYEKYTADLFTKEKTKKKIVVK